MEPDSPPFAAIEAPRLTLRRFRPSDLAAFMAYRNDPQVARYQGWEGMDEAQARAFIAEQQTAQPRVPGRWLQIALEERGSGELIGDCALRADDHDTRLAEIGITVARAHQRRGYAREALSHLLDHAFSVLAIHRVVAYVDVRNAASIALLERLGMRREGHLIEDYWCRGAWISDYLYAMLARERRPPAG